MQEKLTISISSESKKLIKRHARQQNKTVSRFLEDLFADTIKKGKDKLPKDQWLEETAGIYNSGSGDILNAILKGIAK